MTRFILPAAVAAAIGLGAAPSQANASWLSESLHALRGNYYYNYPGYYRRPLRGRLQGISAPTPADVRQGRGFTRGYHYNPRYRGWHGHHGHGPAVPATTTAIRGTAITVKSIADKWGRNKSGPASFSIQRRKAISPVPRFRPRPAGTRPVRSEPAATGQWERRRCPPRAGTPGGAGRPRQARSTAGHVGSRRKRPGPVVQQCP